MDTIIQLEDVAMVKTVAKLPHLENSIAAMKLLGCSAAVMNYVIVTSFTA